MDPIHVIYVFLSIEINFKIVARDEFVTLTLTLTLSLNYKYF